MFSLLFDQTQPTLTSLFSTVDIRSCRRAIAEYEKSVVCICCFTVTLLGPNAITMTNDVERHRYLRRLMTPGLASEEMDAALPRLAVRAENLLEGWATEGDAGRKVSALQGTCMSVDLTFQQQSVLAGLQAMKRVLRKDLVNKTQACTKLHLIRRFPSIISAVKRIRTKSEIVNTSYLAWIIETFVNICYIVNTDCRSCTRFPGFYVQVFAG